MIDMDCTEREVMISAQDGERVQQDMGIKAATIGNLQVRT